jgi:hypothetical protein
MCHSTFVHEIVQSCADCFKKRHVITSQCFYDLLRVGFKFFQLRFDAFNLLHYYNNCPKTRDHWEDLGVGGRITLRWTLGR